ncbi:uncharacterized protein PAC_17026 [Phialocephala subalpina]|uniref:BTB domain-containing protein n=1 Tax=Phialocephala subalpina TaxID=576137 RepID=A0A1L7XQB5_9HELO|nr:uncharacterized protein PAC_17026 [Phialocephala subalpina]
MTDECASPAEERATTRSFNTAFGTEMIRIVVAPEQKCQKVYRIHKSKFCSMIPFFTTVIEQIKALQGAEAGWTNGWSWDPFAFYALTDSLALHSLSDEVINLLQAGQAKTKLWHTNETLSWTWARTKPGCGIRRYLALSLVRSIMVYKDPKDVDPKKRVFTVGTKEIAEMLGKFPDLLVEVLELMRGMDGLKARDPRVAHPCEFHEHWPRKPCGYDNERDLEDNSGENGNVERKKDDGSNEEIKGE